MRKTARSEMSEQMEVITELRRLRVLSRDRVRYFAVPNGGSRRRGEGARLQASGVVSGVPDVLILGGVGDADVTPLSAEEIVLVRTGVAGMPADDLVRRLLATLDARSGFALEMKREDSKPKSVTFEQDNWLAWLTHRMGWGGAVGFGADDALRKLKAAGYDVRTTVDRLDSEDKA